MVEVETFLGKRRAVAKPMQLTSETKKKFFIIVEAIGKQLHWLNGLLERIYEYRRRTEDGRKVYPELFYRNPQLLKSATFQN